MGGDTLKLAAVTALAIVAGPAVAGLTPFAVGSAGFLAVSAVTSIAVTAIAGKALGLDKVNLDDVQPIDGYATSSLQNQTNNNNVVPIIYDRS